MKVKVESESETKEEVVEETVVGNSKSPQNSSTLRSTSKDLPISDIKTESVTKTPQSSSPGSEKSSIVSQNSPQLSTGSSTSTPMLPGNAEMFASIIGQELAATYHLHTQNFIRLENGQLVPRIPVSLPMSIPNGFHPHPELMKRLQPNSPPMGQLGNGQVPPNNSIESAKLQRLPSDMKTEQNATAQILDTAEVALRIREILSAHNIGQRLFAKHVLGLSQGTVSELLSKPKHWDKLTEKGRESYRKMHAWASVETNVLSLKAISPKKGRQKIYILL